MKTAAFMIMLIALFLLYRIAYPKRSATKKSNEILPKKEVDISELVVKSRFIRPNPGQLQTTPTTSVKTDLQGEKQKTFAGGNGHSDGVIPSTRLNEVFDSEVNPEELDISPDEDERTDEANLEEEAEDLRQVLGRDAEYAEGLSMEEMTEVAEAIDNPTDEKGGLLFRVETTDMFEKLVRGDEGKAARIREVIERHLRNQCDEGEMDGEEDDRMDNDWRNFDMQKFL